MTEKIKYGLKAWGQFMLLTAFCTLIGVVASSIIVWKTPPEEQATAAGNRMKVHWYVPVARDTIHDTICCVPVPWRIIDSLRAIRGTQ